jgi:hypothetical protein
LPIFLFSAGFIALLKGSFGQPTTVGFAVILNALCLAAANVVEPVAAEKPAVISGPRPRPIGRSVYATRMHAKQTNGSGDQ